MTTIPVHLKPCLVDLIKIHTSNLVRQLEDNFRARQDGGSVPEHSYWMQPEEVEIKNIARKPYMNLQLLRIFDDDKAQSNDPYQPIRLLLSDRESHIYATLEEPVQALHLQKRGFPIRDALKVGGFIALSYFNIHFKNVCHTSMIQGVTLEEQDVVRNSTSTSALTHFSRKTAGSGRNGSLKPISNLAKLCHTTPKDLKVEITLRIRACGVSNLSSGTAIIGSPRDIQTKPLVFEDLQRLPRVPIRLPSLKEWSAKIYDILYFVIIEQLWHSFLSQNPSLDDQKAKREKGRLYDLFTQDIATLAKFFDQKVKHFIENLFSEKFVNMTTKQVLDFFEHLKETVKFTPILVDDDDGDSTSFPVGKKRKLFEDSGSDLRPPKITKFHASYDPIQSTAPYATQFAPSEPPQSIELFEIDDFFHLGLDKAQNIKCVLERQQCGDWDSLFSNILPQIMQVVLENMLDKMKEQSIQDILADVFDKTNNPEQRTLRVNGQNMDIPKANATTKPDACLYCRDVLDANRAGLNDQFCDKHCRKRHKTKLRKLAKASCGYCRNMIPKNTRTPGYCNEKCLEARLNVDSEGVVQKLDLPVDQGESQEKDQIELQSKEGHLELQHDTHEIQQESSNSRRKSQSLSRTISHNHEIISRLQSTQLQVTEQDLVILQHDTLEDVDVELATQAFLKRKQKLKDELHILRYRRIEKNFGHDLPIPFIVPPSQLEKLANYKSIFPRPNPQLQKEMASRRKVVRPQHDEDDGVVNQPASTANMGNEDNYPPSEAEQITGAAEEPDLTGAEDNMILNLDNKHNRSQKSLDTPPHTSPINRRQTTPLLPQHPTQVPFTLITQSTPSTPSTQSESSLRETSPPWPSQVEEVPIVMPKTIVVPQVGEVNFDEEATGVDGKDRVPRPRAPITKSVSAPLQMVKVSLSDHMHGTDSIFSHTSKRAESVDAVLERDSQALDGQDLDSSMPNLANQPLHDTASVGDEEKSSGIMPIPTTIVDVNMEPAQNSFRGQKEDLSQDEFHMKDIVHSTPEQCPQMAVTLDTPISKIAGKVASPDSIAPKNNSLYAPRRTTLPFKIPDQPLETQDVNINTVSSIKALAAPLPKNVDSPQAPTSAQAPIVVHSSVVPPNSVQLPLSTQSSQVHDQITSSSSKESQSLSWLLKSSPLRSSQRISPAPNTEADKATDDVVEDVTDGVASEWLQKIQTIQNMPLEKIGNLTNINPDDITNDDIVKIHQDYRAQFFQDIPDEAQVEETVPACIETGNAPEEPVLLDVEMQNERQVVPSGHQPSTTLKHEVIIIDDDDDDDDAAPIKHHSDSLETASRENKEDPAVQIEEVKSRKRIISRDTSFGEQQLPAKRRHLSVEIRSRSNSISSVISAGKSQALPLHIQANGATETTSPRRPTVPSEKPRFFQANSANFSHDKPNEPHKTHSSSARSSIHEMSNISTSKKAQYDHQQTNPPNHVNETKRKKELSEAKAKKRAEIEAKIQAKKNDIKQIQEKLAQLEK